MSLSETGAAGLKGAEDILVHTVGGCKRAGDIQVHALGGLVRSWASGGVKARGAPQVGFWLFHDLMLFLLLMLWPSH